MVRIGGCFNPHRYGLLHTVDGRDGVLSQTLHPLPLFFLSFVKW